MGGDPYNNVVDGVALVPTGAVIGFAGWLQPLGFASIPPQLFAGHPGLHKFQHQPPDMAARRQHVVLAHL